MLPVVNALRAQGRNDELQSVSARFADGSVRTTVGLSGEMFEIEVWSGGRDSKMTDADLRRRFAAQLILKIADSDFAFGQFRTYSE